ncbi:MULTISPECIES: transglutaminase-like domain-containing protein [unclassified Paenibacillus]|uniref:transglutaminase-like domain-containing protein n=1 Tax=unclassified Paenibacillus TaxID=185978 RepID=UPI002F3FC3C0
MRMIKWVMLLVTMSLLAVLIGGAGVEAQVSKWLDSSQLSQGIIFISYPVQKNIKTKLMIVKGNDRYTYTLSGSKKKESFPLQMGNGKYIVYVLEHVSGNSYKRVANKEVTLKLKSSNAVFLNSIQNIYWTSESAAVIKAKELTKNMNTNEEKVRAIYNFVYKTIKYDSKLAADVSNDYLPDIDRTLKLKKDICYGYASLFAAMLRSQQIPTKLVMGESSYVKVYHAWNEVYLNGKWVIIDTTVDASLLKVNKKASMIKDSSKYKAAKVY